jgi:hypothetical protein
VKRETDRAERLEGVAGETWQHLTAEKMIGGARVTSREVTQAVFENYNAKPPRKFTSLSSKPLTPAVTPRGGVKKKGNTDGVLIR